ncbi:MAG: hypothetical protein KAJ07_07995 [Planctomycetes bacterium]|nr:hypothetical protein [Planctomycetota bacterium]
MSRRLKKAFSLTEVLMAAGILAIGFMLIAMIFPVGIKLTASATEKTIGVVAAKEAEAKLKLYAGDPLTMDFARFKDINIAGTDYNELMLFEDVVGSSSIFYSKSYYDGTNYYHEGFYDLLYPSRDYCDPQYYPPADQADVMRYQTHTEEASYRWTALCVETANPNEVETLILVTRKISKNASFPVPQWDTNPPAGEADYGYTDASLVLTPNVYPYPKPGYWPMPVRVDLICVDYNLRIWEIDTSVDPDAGRYINKGDTVIDSLYDGVGIEHFQIIDKDRHGIELDGDFNRPGVTFTPGTTVVTVWVVPPAAGSARSPLVGVYSGGPIVFN